MAVSTPNLDMLRLEVGRLLADGVSSPLVEDKIIGKSAQSAELYQRALQEWALLPKVVTEGGSTYRTGIKSAGCRRSVSGFREHILGRGA
jgi:hypothetical protein